MESKIHLILNSICKLEVLFIVTSHQLLPMFGRFHCEMSQNSSFCFFMCTLENFFFLFFFFISVVFSPGCFWLPCLAKQPADF